MTFTLRSVTICDPSSTHHQHETDVQVKGGIISAIGKDIASEGEEIDGKGMLLTTGWVDLWADFCEPGFEHKETIHSGLTMAARAGFTRVCTVPNTDPIIDSRATVRFVKEQGKNHVTSVFPYAAVSKGTNTTDFTEIVDISQEGVTAFSNGYSFNQSSEFFVKVLQYLKPLDAVLITLVEDADIAVNKCMHEGLVSTRMGLNGYPSVSEAMTLRRLLSLVEYSDGKVHFSHLSSAESVAIMREAKSKSPKITCDVSLGHLLFTDEDLIDFDSNHKVVPPYRTKEDQQALIEGLKDGTIDAIVSSHRPQDEDSKMVDFLSASYGASTIPAFAAGITSLAELVPMDMLMEKLTTGPRNVLGFEATNIAVGQKAELTLFNPDHEWTLDHASNDSKSQNSPFFGQQLKGKALAVFNGERYSLPEGRINS
jgi:dihydroorotase